MELLFLGLLIIRWLIRLYIYVLWARFILDWVRVFKPRWRPRGLLLILLELVYTLTDPPIKFFRKLLPPIRLGQISLDLGWMVTIFICHLVLLFIPVVTLR